MAELDVIQSLEEEREGSIVGSVIVDGEEEEEEDGVVILMDLSPIPINPDPVIIRGVGNFTLFGLNNKFDTKFPIALSAKVAPEEFSTSIKHINAVLKRTTKTNLRWTIQSVEKVLKMENSRLYKRLGLHWSFKFVKSDNTSMTEMVLMLEFLPRISFYRPD